MKATVYFTDDATRHQLCALVLKGQGNTSQTTFWGNKDEMLGYLKGLGDTVKSVTYGGKALVAA